MKGGRGVLKILRNKQLNGLKGLSVLRSYVDLKMGFDCVD